MELRKKILGHFLLGTYLLVLFHNCAFHVHHTIDHPSSGIEKNLAEDDECGHFEHQFHIGIFHFIGHLLENINHSDHVADTHVLIASNSHFNKSIGQIDASDVLLYFYEIEYYSKEVPGRISLDNFETCYSEYHNPNTPLRAPPVLS